MCTGAEDSEKGNIMRYNPYGGYPRLAKSMGDTPDVAIFSRFLDLSTESLLHYQAELHDIQSDLRRFQKADRDIHAGEIRNAYEFSSTILREAFLLDLDDNSDPDLVKTYFDGKKQWRMILRAQKTIEDYSEFRTAPYLSWANIVLSSLTQLREDGALLLHRRIVNLSKPPQGLKDSLNHWMRLPARGIVFLKGSDSELWKDSKLNELTTMEQTTSDDTASSTLRVVKLYHDIIGRFIQDETDKQHRRDDYRQHVNWAIKIERGAKTLVACMIPILGVLVLYFVQDKGARLGVIVAFTAVFSVTLSVLATAAIKDIFSATAAFPAVLVVFVGTS